MSNGIKVAKRSFEVSKAGSDDLYLDTNMALLKLYKSGSGKQRFPTTSTPQSYVITVRHDLEYIPFVLFYMERHPGKVRRLVTSTDVVFNTTVTQADITCLLSGVYDDRIEVLASASGADGVPFVGDYAYNYFIFMNKVK